MFFSIIMNSQSSKDSIFHPEINSDTNAYTRPKKLVFPSIKCTKFSTSTTRIFYFLFKQYLSFAIKFKLPSGEKKLSSLNNNQIFVTTH